VVNWLWSRQAIAQHGVVHEVLKARERRGGAGLRALPEVLDFVLEVGVERLDLGDELAQSAHGVDAFLDLGAVLRGLVLLLGGWPEAERACSVGVVEGFVLEELHKFGKLGG
jgi:hypothetical protein